MITFWNGNATYFAKNLTAFFSFSALFFLLYWSNSILPSLYQPCLEPHFIPTLSTAVSYSCCFCTSLPEPSASSGSGAWACYSLLHQAVLAAPHLSVMNRLHYLSLAYKSTSDKYCTINCCICIQKIKRTLTFFCCVWIKYFRLHWFYSKSQRYNISQKLSTEEYKERIAIEGVIVFKYVLFYTLYLF